MLSFAIGIGLLLASLPVRSFVCSVHLCSVPIFLVVTGAPSVRLLRLECTHVRAASAAPQIRLLFSDVLNPILITASSCIALALSFVAASSEPTDWFCLAPFHVHCMLAYFDIHCLRFVCFCLRSIRRTTLACCSFAVHIVLWCESLPDRGAVLPVFEDHGRLAKKFSFRKSKKSAFIM